MPSHSTKQAKVMSAIAHGWKPKGSVAKIPLKVAEDFHSADAGHKYGKGHHQRATCGVLKLAYEIRRANGGQVHVGPIVSTVPGRTDHHPMDVPSGAYVLPAEFVSHMGENNTLAGLEKIKKLGTDGLKRMCHSCGGTVHGRGGRNRASGGSSGGTGQPIPINAAGGEFVVPPDWVHHIGDSDMTKGHKMLDVLVMARRKSHVETLKKLRPPAQD